MTSLEYRILQYIEKRNEQGPPPLIDHIRRYCEPDSVTHVVNRLWAQNLITQGPRARKWAHRGFVLTEKGREALRPAMVG